MSSSLARRVAKLNRTIVEKALKKPTVNVTGWEFDKICGAIDASIDPACEELWNRVMDYVDPPESEGQEGQRTHHFSYWLWGLEIGSWHLPRRIGREFLEGFDRYCGAVLFRC